MSSKVFDSVTFEKDTLPTITDPTIFNGMPAAARPLGQADDSQAYLLYKGPCNTVLTGSSQFSGTKGTAQSGTVKAIVPAYATHVQVGVVAAGVGTVTIETNYQIEVSNPGPSGNEDELAGAAVIWGPGDSSGLVSTLTHNGTSQLETFDWEREADVFVYGFCFRWFRRSSTL